MLARAAKQPSCLSCPDQVALVHDYMPYRKHKKHNTSAVRVFPGRAS